jgi:protein disulfide-isomerase
MRYLLALCLLTMATIGVDRRHAAQAAEPELKGWHTDADTAWRSAQAQGRPLLIFVTRENCLYCVKMKRRTLVDQRVARAIEDGYVPLVLDATQPSPLSKELAVAAFPTTFVISPQAIVLDRIDGYLTADAFTARLGGANSWQAQTARVAQSP